MYFDFFVCVLIFLTLVIVKSIWPEAGCFLRLKKFFVRT